MEAGPNIFLLKSGKKTRRIRFDEIEYIHCDYPICDLHLVNKKVFTCTKTLRYFEDFLSDNNFCRISNNTIVNLDQIEEVVSMGGHRHNVVMKNGEVITISYRKWKGFKESLK